MGQSSPNSSRYVITSANAGLGTQEFWGVYNNNVAHNLKLCRIDLSHFLSVVPTSFSFILQRRNGGIPNITITPLPVNPDVPPAIAIGVKGAWAVSGSLVSSLLNIAGNSKKPWSWDARPGKEFQIYAATDSLLMFFNNPSSGTEPTIQEITIVFEE
jgi:hypothetical protein